MTAILEYPYRPKLGFVLGFLALFTIVVVYFTWFLLTEDRLSASFTAKLLILSAIAALYVVVLPFAYIQSKRWVVRLTDADLSVDNLFGRKTISRRDIDRIELAGTNNSRSMLVHAGEKKIAINQVLMPGADAFDRLYQALEKGLSRQR